jgi:hypothetical protein
MVLGGSQTRYYNGLNDHVEDRLSEIPTPPADLADLQQLHKTLISAGNNVRQRKREAPLALHHPKGHHQT